MYRVQSKPFMEKEPPDIPGLDGSEFFIYFMFG